VRPLLALAVLLLAACGGSKPLPPPGATGTVRFYIWDERVDRPTVVTATRIRQEGLHLDTLELLPVVMQVALPEGNLTVDAPSATWDRKNGVLTFAEPVLISGRLRGQPVLGRAKGATIDRSTRTLELTELELVHAGARMTTPRARLGQDRHLDADSVRSGPAPAGLAAALAVLPMADPPR
jgi:hypothetical protein